MATTESTQDILTYLQKEYGLDESQAPAANHLDGPALVLASAGSGKTTTLTARVTHLMRHYLIPPENILCITFTNKATEHMKRKIAQKVGEDRALPTISTIHSLGLSVIRQHPRAAFEAFATLAGVDLKSLSDDHKGVFLSTWSERNCETAFRKICAEREIKDSGDLLDEINYLCNRGYTPDTYNALRESNLQVLKDERVFLTETNVELWREYFKVKVLNRAMDFQDMILISCYLLEHNEKLRAKYYARFKYICQDEAQDASPLQWKLLELLTDPSTGSLFAVGDAAQAIMGFQGSDPHLINKFKTEFKGIPTKFYHLANNYRSHPVIVDVANAVEHKLIQNHPAPMVAKAGLPGETPSLSYTEYADSAKEATAIVATIQELADMPIVQLARTTLGPSAASARQPLRASVAPPRLTPAPAHSKKPFHLKDIAILVRTKMMIPTIENALLMGRVPYYVKDGKSLLQSKEVVDVMSYLKLMVNPFDSQAFDRAVQLPKRGFGAESIRKLSESAQARGVDLLTASKYEAKLDSFLSLLQGLNILVQEQPKNITHTIEEWVIRTGYQTEIKKSSKDLDDEMRRKENLNRFTILAQEVMDTSDFTTLEELLDHIILMQDAGNATATDDRVHIMTAHSAKGLEYQVVFAPCFFDGAIPHTRSFKSEEELAEEARLTYVIVTRAIRQLRISRPQFYAARGSSREIATSRSRFFDPMRSFFMETKNRL